MSVINTTENGGTSTTQVTDTISIDSASGNNRALVVFVGILDNDSTV